VTSATSPSISALRACSECGTAACYAGWDACPEAVSGVTAGGPVGGSLQVVRRDRRAHPDATSALLGTDLMMRGSKSTKRSYLPGSMAPGFGAVGAGRAVILHEPVSGADIPVLVAELPPMLGRGPHGDQVDVRVAMALSAGMASTFDLRNGPFFWLAGRLAAVMPEASKSLLEQTYSSRPRATYRPVGWSWPQSVRKSCWSAASG
jgi:hypothetical protein